MSFRLKIFLLCILVYILALVVTCVVVTEDNYQELLKSEVERCLNEQGSIYSTAVLYLIANLQQDGNKIEIEGYGQRLVDMFGTSETHIELLKEDMQVIATNHGDMGAIPREELKEALKGNKSYILRTVDGVHYLFISQLIQVDNKRMIMTVIKDITQVDRQRASLYMLFIEVGIVGMVFVAVITAVMSRYVTRRIEALSKSAEIISSGSYSERVRVGGRDEIGRLASQFNIMAGEIEKKIGELQEEGERKQRFIDNLTHEMRTPLTSVIGFSEFLAAARHDEETWHKSLNYINSEGKRMLKLVNQLMDMILLRQNNLNMESSSILPLLEEVAAIMTAKADRNGIVLNVEGSDTEISMDRDMIKGVLINLADNAINASSSGGRIILGVDRNERGACIYVRDEGKGMSAEDAEKVLEPFYRVDKSRSRKEGGLGLGLSLCNEIVKAHGARLEIDSEAGKGTTVTIRF